MKKRGQNKAEKQTVTNCELLPYKFIKKNNSGKKLSKPLCSNFQWLEKYIGEEPYVPLKNNNDCFALLQREKFSTLVKNTRRQHTKQNKNQQLNKKSLDIKMKNQQLNVDAKKANINLIKMKDFSSDNCSLIFEERNYKLKRRHFRNKSTQIQQCINNQPCLDKALNINYIPDNKISFQFRRTQSKQYESHKRMHNRNSIKGSKGQVEQKREQSKSIEISERQYSNKVNRKYSEFTRPVKQFNPIFTHSFQTKQEQIQSSNAKKFLKSVKNLRVKRVLIRDSVKTSKNVCQNIQNSVKEQEDIENQPNIGNVQIISDFCIGQPKQNNSVFLDPKYEYEHKLDFQIRKQQKAIKRILNEQINSTTNEIFEMKLYNNQSNEPKCYYTVQNYKQKRDKNQIASRKNKIDQKDQIRIQPWKPIVQIDQQFCIFNCFQSENVGEFELAEGTIQKKVRSNQQRISSKFIR